MKLVEEMSEMWKPERYKDTYHEDLMRLIEKRIKAGKTEVVTTPGKEEAEEKPGGAKVVDLMALQPQSEHPHGLSDKDFDVLFTRDKPIVFAYHGYPWLIHRLTYRRHNHANLHVRGYKEEGSTTTPFDMVVLNNMDRYQLALDAIRRIPRLRNRVDEASERYRQTIARHRAYVSEHGEDMPEIRDWRWTAPRP